MGFLKVLRPPSPRLELRGWITIPGVRVRIELSRAAGPAPFPVGERRAAAPAWGSRPLPRACYSRHSWACRCGMAKGPWGRCCGAGCQGRLLLQTGA